MGEVAGAQDRDALAPGPPGELREVSIAAGGSGVAGVDVQIGIKPHGPLPFTPDDRYPAVGPGVGERDRRVVWGSGCLGRVLELLNGLRPGDLGSNERPESAPNSNSEQQPKAAHLSALAQPPDTVLPAGKPLPLEPPASECSVLTEDRERGPVNTRAAGAPEQ